MDPDERTSYIVRGRGCCTSHTSFGCGCGRDVGMDVIPKWPSTFLKNNEDLTSTSGRRAGRIQEIVFLLF